MKAASLFHLLQLSLRSISPDCPHACRDRLAEVQRGLRIQHARGFFELNWRYGGRELNLSVADREFGFHVAGDTPTAVERRGDVTAMRARNWQAAAELWRRMAAVSGFAVPDDAFPPALAPAAGAATDGGGRSLVVETLGAAAIVALIAYLVADLQAGIGAGLMSALLAGFVWTLDETHLHDRLDRGGTVLLAAGALASLLADWRDPGVIPLLAGITTAAWLERRGCRFHAWWVAAGMLAGLGASLGWPGSAGALAFAVALLLAAWFAPAKLARPAALALAAGALVAVIVVAALGYPSTTGDDGNLALRVAAWAVALAILVAFLAWWIQGSMFYVVPWLGMGALALAAVAAVGTGGATAGVMALSGLAALLTVRLARAILRGSRGR